jgi:catechol 2,3-dioxygenase-like lactoylglutathione lyase family enzyme
MAIQAMNHFTVLTLDMAATRRFYVDMLGFTEGARPPFGFDGAWFYVGDQPILHIVASGRMPKDPKGTLDHMAFSATDLKGTVAKLNANGVAYELRKLQDYGTWQLFFEDPNGATVELDFDAAEAAP